MKQPISIVRGTTNYFRVDVFDPDGNKFIMNGVEKLVLAVKQNPTDNEKLILKTIPGGGETEYIFSFYPEDTINIEPGRYMYDVALQSGSSVFYNVIEASLFEIKPNVAELGDGS